jgi:hypothetical protein
MHPEIMTVCLGRACRIFLDLAYPGGPETIPPARRCFYDLNCDRSAAEILDGAPAEVCQPIEAGGDRQRGYALRLGSSHFPHLKLKLQLIDHDAAGTWVFTVDTHDAFSKQSVYPPSDHPDAAAWIALQAANRDLKSRIENAFEEAGLVTFNSLLRRDLARSQAGAEADRPA